MIELEDEIYDMLEADVTVRGYTGWVSGGDIRIYHEWPPELVTVDATYPAYVTLGFQAPGAILMSEYVQNAQYPDEIAEINVWANSALLRGQIADRIMEIFWVNNNTFIDLTSFIVMRVMQESAINGTEILEEGTRQITLWRKSMMLRFGPIYAKLMGE